MTTCRTPASAAPRKKSVKYRVRAPWKLTKYSPQLGVFSRCSGSLPSSTSATFPPTARQNTSANGSTANGSGFCGSNARAVATNNAVSPTLVLMFQVSLSVRTGTDPTPAQHHALSPEIARSSHDGIQYDVVS